MGRIFSLTLTFFFSTLHSDVKDIKELNLITVKSGSTEKEFYFGSKRG